MPPKNKGRKNKQTRIHVIDVSNWLNRAYFAAPKLSTSTGIPTGSLKTFMSMVHKLYLDKESEHDHFVFAFDCPRKDSWRYKFTLDSEHIQYKGNRDTDDASTDLRKTELGPQFDYAWRILNAAGFCCIRTKSMEADDIIGTISRIFGVEDIHVYIYSRDKDFIQCLTPNVTLIQQAQANAAERIFRFDNAAEHYVAPEQMVEYLMLVGDSADSVKGVSGIGEKKAVQLLEKYGDIATAYSSGKVTQFKTVTQEYLDDMRELVTIVTNCPFVPKSVSALKRKPIKEKALRRFKAELEFKKLLHLEY